MANVSEYRKKSIDINLRVGRGVHNSQSVGIQRTAEMKDRLRVDIPDYLRADPASN